MSGVGMVTWFTEKKHCVIINRINSRGTILFKMGCVLIDLNNLILLLAHYFPDLIFIRKKDNVELGRLDIINYVHYIDNKWTLDLAAMSRNKMYAHLFHEDFAALWNEEEAIRKYGCADVIRFFLDIENNKFLDNFNEADLSCINKDEVIDMFLDELNYYECKYVYEKWNFPVIHKSPTIYKAFDRYARRIYTLLGFFKHPKEFEIQTLIEENSDWLLNTIMEQNFTYPYEKINNFEIERKTAFFELVQEILESVPKDESIYALTGIDSLLYQLDIRMINFMRDKKYDKEGGVENYEETFNHAERTDIKKRFAEIDQYIKKEKKDITKYCNLVSEYCKLKEKSKHWEKVIFLHRLIQEPSIREHYSPKKSDEEKLVRIHGYFLKLQKPLELQKPLSLNKPIDKESEESSFLIDTIKDDKQVPPEMTLSWTSLFKNEFKQVFDESELKIFLECIPDHFKKERSFRFDNNGKITMNNYYKGQLYKTFCKAAGIEQDRERLPFFREAIQRVLDNINKINETGSNV
jgi:hypothetical protein